MWNDILKVYANSKKESASKKIAKYLIKLDKGIFETNLSKTSKKLGVSPSTVTKFLNKVGYSGWKMYTAIALLNLNKNQIEIKDNLLGKKIEISAWIDLAFTKDLKLLAKKIISSSSLILFAHNQTKSALKIFKRNLSILGFNVDIRDISDKYLIFPKKYSSVTIMFSLTGNNLFLDNSNEKLNSINCLGYKVFISPSKKSFKGINSNINLEGSSIYLNNLENIFPVLKTYFINHVLDKIQFYIFELQKENINLKYLNTKIWKK